MIQVLYGATWLWAYSTSSLHFYMKEYRGILKRIGAKEGDMIVNTRANSSVGNVRVSGSVSVVEIGDTVLRDVGCTRDIYDLLDVGKSAILYVHYKNFRKPIILGVAYPAEGPWPMR